MKYLKMLGLAAVSAMALMAFAAGSASATTLEVGGVTKNEAVALVSTIKAGTSAILKDEFFETLNTCTESEVSGESESPFSGATVTGTVSELTFKNCTRSVTVHQKGKLHVEHIAGTTNGTVRSSGAEVTSNSVFGYLNCKTGNGTHLGTLTGVKEGHAEIKINASIGCSGVAANWSGTYTVTSPTGLGVSA